MEGDDAEGFVAASPELPEVLGAGPTATRAATELCWRLEDRVFAILSANRLPPEPLQDVEARQSQQLKWQNTAPGDIALAA
jgi:hypothetical protein